MNRLFFIFFIAFFLLFTSFILLSFSQVSASKENFIISPLPNDLKENSTDQNSPPTINIKPVLKSKINILLLGLDARKGDSHPRCDAIQMISFDFDKNIMTITSVPRGTEVQLSKNDQDTNYISNFCHYFGTEVASTQIEKITGIHPDYTVKLGFSQTLGILRNLNIPTTPTLQFLRNRATGYGDYQRTHNQAVFIKDMFVKNMDNISNVPDLFKYFIFKIMDTDIPFDVAKELFNRIKDSQIANNPDLIKLSLKPEMTIQLKNVHLANSGENWKSDGEFIEYQKDLNIYLENLILRVGSLINSRNNAAAFSLLKTPYAQQIWSQIENEKLRNDYHFALLKYYLQTSPDNENLSTLVSDFVNEMDITRQNELKTKGEILLKTLI